MTQSSSLDRIFANYEFTEGKFLTPFQRKKLLKNLQSDLQREYRRRIEIMLLADMGKSQAHICETICCSQEMARYWIAVAQAGMAHKWHERPVGRPKLVNEQYLQRLKELVSNSPRDYGYPFKSWTALWLSKHLMKEFGIDICARHINRLLKKMGLSTRQRSENKNIHMDKEEDRSIKIYDLQSRCQTETPLSFNLIQSHK
ncbi:helix-turn-helix domain-containing protein [Calothrix rhizosoleniae]|uniref:helix-turn-helix domain-containing protein n=1 Tax=Calothrix rhizosoleniae TaxID=888997 RepID=UPI000B49D7AC|nr:helix-turn-helix domain-containing protein [Calothrix rhizosoleniae]